MPEGHTIHRLARDHARWFGGELLEADSPQGRAAEVAAAVHGRRLLGADAYGKHLFHRWEGGLSVHIHLGLFGRFRQYRAPGPDPRPSVRLRLSGEERTLMLIGATACELIEPPEEAELLDRLGPDPLRDDADPALAREAFSRRRVPIAAALLDQKAIAGVGNVFRAEALHILRIDPFLPARELDPGRADELWEALGVMLDRGVRERRIRTKRDARGKGRSTYVYRRRSCGSCNGPISDEELAGRRLWWCPRCQPAGAG